MLPPGMETVCDVRVEEETLVMGMTVVEEEVTMVVSEPHWATGVIILMTETLLEVTGVAVLTPVTLPLVPGPLILIRGTAPDDPTDMTDESVLTFLSEVTTFDVVELVEEEEVTVVVLFAPPGSISVLVTVDMLIVIFQDHGATVNWYQCLFHYLYLASLSWNTNVGRENADHSTICQTFHSP